MTHKKTASLLIAACTMGIISPVFADHAKPKKNTSLPTEEFSVSVDGFSNYSEIVGLVALGNSDMKTTKNTVRLEDGYITAVEQEAGDPAARKDALKKGRKNFLEAVTVKIRRDAAKASLTEKNFFHGHSYVFCESPKPDNAQKASKRNFAFRYQTY